MDRSIRYFNNCKGSVEKDAKNQRNEKNQPCPTEFAGPENERSSQEVHWSIVLENEDA